MPITYNNVPTKGAGAGNLFQDMKFWVAMRVPRRDQVLNNIRTNGGDVVQLEKNADYLIADPLRQPPSGSYNFAWITESIGKGELLPADKYLNPNATAAVPTRKSAGGVASRSVRVPFTPSDDRFLWLFVIEMERRGEPTEGNAIYQKLETENPRHTYQSWRNRWVKQLRGAKRPVFPEEEVEEMRARVRKLLDRSSSEPAATATSRPAPSADALPPASDVTLSAGRPARDNGIKIRHKFTREEDKELLIKWLDVDLSGGAKKKSVMFNELPDDKHTVNSWRDRLFKTLQPAAEKKLRTTLAAIGKAGIPTFVTWFHHSQPAEAYWERVGSQPPPPSTESDEEEEEQEEEEEEEDSKEEKAEKEDGEELAPENKPGPELEPEQASKQEKSKAAGPVKKNQVRADPFPNADKGTVVLWSEDDSPERVKKPRGRPKRAVSPPQPAVQSTPEQAPARGSMQAEGGVEVEEKEDAEAGQVQTERLVQEEPEEKLKAEQQVEEGEDQEAGDDSPYSQYGFYRDYQGWLEATNHILEHFPSIAGRSFDLFDLWSQVMEQDTPPEERDSSTWETVAGNLGIDWMEYPDAPEQFRLFFREHLANFEEALLSFEERDEEMTDTQSEQIVPSSPAAARQLKRPPVLADDLYQPSEPGRKRQRRGRNDEIPSTPDDKTNTAHLRRYDRADDEDADLADASTLRRNGGRSETQTQKETQYFDAPEHGEGDIEEDDMSPSRQLWLESDAMEQPAYARSSPPFIPAGFLAQATTSTPRKGARTPFRQDDSDEEGERLTPVRNTEDVKGKGKEVAVAKRRSLPKSFIRAKGDEEGDDDDAGEGDGGVQYPKLPHRAAQSPAQPRSLVAATSRAQARPQTSTSMAAASTSEPSASRASTTEPTIQKVEQVIDYHISLGYTRDIVLKAMYATTWAEGLSGIVMEELKQGRGIPINARGVWTEKDDGNLMLLDGKTEGNVVEGMVKKEKMDKKIAKARKKLENKFTAEMIEQRRKFWREGNAWRMAK